MVNIETARQIALSLPGTVEKDHFGRPSFCVNGRIFSTLWLKEQRMMVKLSVTDQDVFHSFNQEVFYAVPNKWGLKGATFIELARVRPDMLEDALTTAWQLIVSKKIKA